MKKKHNYVSFYSVDRTIYFQAKLLINTCIMNSYGIPSKEEILTLSLNQGFVYYEILDVVIDYPPI